MPGYTRADGETARFLVRPLHLGYAAHIPDASGYPLCKTNLKLSLWRIEERPTRSTVTCLPCTVAQAKLARS